MYSVEKLLGAERNSAAPIDDALQRHQVYNRHDTALIEFGANPRKSK